jgi:hypothetical protein
MPTSIIGKNFNQRAKDICNLRKFNPLWLASGYKTDLIYTFFYLDARILLSLQHNVQVREQHLKDLDNECAKDTSEFTLLNSFTWDSHCSKILILSE